MVLPYLHMVFTVRVLSNLTQEIEEVLTRVQAYIADKLYHRQLDFLRNINN